MNQRAAPDLDWETRVGYPKTAVIGVDEVGRGCLAGPVVAGAVLLPENVDYEAHSWLHEVADSKLVSPEKRQKLAPLIRDWAKAATVGVATVEEIDRINIYHAAHLAMTRALEAAVATDTSQRSRHILIDGNAVPSILKGGAVTAVVKGDLKCLSIACASIIAKVWRDDWMSRLDAEVPGYGFGIHKGYSTPRHQEALRRLGATRWHRRSFAPVAAVIAATAPLVSPDV